MVTVRKGRTNSSEKELSMTDLTPVGDIDDIHDEKSSDSTTYRSDCTKLASLTKLGE